MATLESIEATQQATLAEVRRLADALEGMDDRLRNNEVCVARLQEQVTTLDKRTSSRQTISDVLTGIGLAIVGAVGALLK